MDRGEKTKSRTMAKEWLAEFWEYRELFYFMVWRDLKIRYRQTALGAIWAVIQPFFTMIVFTLFFGKLAQMPSDGIAYPLFSYAALVPWTYFSGTLALSGNSLINNSTLLTKVYFPRVVIPAAPVLAGLIDFGIASLLLLFMMAYYHVHPGWALLLWPVLTLLMSVLALGMGMILSCVNVKYRDIKYAIPFLIQIWLFVTPVIYPTSIVPDRFRFLMALNPMSGLIEAFRATLFAHRQVDWRLLGCSAGMTALIFTLGLIYFRKTERAFADVI